MFAKELSICSKYSLIFTRSREPGKSGLNANLTNLQNHRQFCSNFFYFSTNKIPKMTRSSSRRSVKEVGCCHKCVAKEDAMYVKCICARTGKGIESR